MKPSLNWKGQGFRFDLSFNNHPLWWSPILLYGGKVLFDIACFSALGLFKSGIIIVKGIFYA